MSLLFKQALAAFGALIDIIGIFAYIRGIFCGSVRPHFFSWLIWTVIMSTGYCAQVADGGGAGSWVLGTGAVTTAVVCILSWFKGERRGTGFDWLFFLLASSGIPLWIITKDPLLSVFLVSGIDLLAHGPTLRKCFLKPETELAFTWILGVVKFSLSLLALEHYSLQTTLYPSSILSANVLVLVAIFWGYRRQNSRL